MLAKPGERFEELVVHAYAGESIAVRQLVRFVSDQDWEIESARYDIAFEPIEHEAAYTLILSKEGQSLLHSVPSSLPTENYLFGRRGQPLDTEPDEWRRAAFLLHLAAKDADSEAGEDYIDAILLEFLRTRADTIGYDDLAERLDSIPVNSPYESELSEKWSGFFEGQLEDMFASLSDIRTGEDVDIEQEWQRPILDLWVDLRWYNPLFSSLFEE